MSTRAQRRRRRKRIAFGLGGFFLAAVLVVILGLNWYASQLTAHPGPKTEVVVVIPKGSSTEQIAKVLQKEGVIRNATAFAWHVRFTGGGPFEAGRYRLTRNLSADDTIAVLTRGPLGPEVVSVSIPEGFRMGQILTRIHDRVPRFSVAALQKLLDTGQVASPLLPAGSKNYEGLLFPATYEVTASETPIELLQEMADTMTRRVDGLTADPSLQSLKLSPYQLVIVASLIQAEAGNPDEAPKIARVIYNRLAAGQPLGIDASSRYLSIITGQKIDFESTSPYNTRRQRGLPPTPIGSAGDFALSAAWQPASGPWLYYVRDVHNDAQGRPQHVFTASPQEFAQAKHACYLAGLGCGP